jgi:hypothetical protein
MVAVGRGWAEVGVAVIEGTATLVGCAGTIVGDIAANAGNAGLGEGVADDAGLGKGVAVIAGLGVRVAGWPGGAVGWIVEGRAMAVPGGTVGTSGSRVSGSGRVAG